jgi:hypothetical protein
MKNSFQSKGIDLHTFFDKRNTIKTTKTCLIKDCNKKIATETTFGKQQSNHIATHNEKLNMWRP